MPEIKKLDAAGFDHFIEVEGLELLPYLDTKKIYTIGIGMTYWPRTGKRITGNDPALTRQQAIDEFKLIVAQFETTVWSVTRDDITQNQFNALCSICYNIGITGFRNSTFLRLINAGAINGDIAAAIWMWTKDKELMPRRAKEIMLYFGKSYAWVDGLKLTKAQWWEEIRKRL